MRTRLAPLLLLLTACGGAAAPPPEPASAPTPPATPGADVAPPAAPEGEKKADKPDEKKPDVAPAAKPASKWTIGGVSISNVEGTAILDALKGWVAPTAGVGGMTMASYTSMNVGIQKGKAKGRFQIVRPAEKPEPPSPSSRPIPPAELGDRVDKEKGAFLFDPEADVFVSVELEEGGKAADAKKLLDAVVKKEK